MKRWEDEDARDPFPYGADPDWRTGPAEPAPFLEHARAAPPGPALLDAPTTVPFADAFADAGPLAGTAPAPLLDLGDASWHTIVDAGPSENRVDVWFVGDGYAAGQLDLLLADAAAQWDWMTTEASAQPFGAYADLFNVHVLFVPSAEEGADRPDDGVFVDTAFDASFSWGGGPEHFLYFDAYAAERAIRAVAPGTDIDMRFGAVNAERYGGGGGAYAVYAAGADDARGLALHELGHAFAGLADEYWTPGAGAYEGPGPDAPNATTDPDDAPWAHWLGFDDGVLGPIGAYEGGVYAETGVFRPTENSLMRSIGRPFDAVARERFVLDFYASVDPLDAWSFEGEAALTDVYDPFWIDTVSDALIGQEWFVDGKSVGTGTELDFAGLGFGPGTYEVSVTAADDSPFVRQGREQLSQTVTWSLTLNYRQLGGTDLADDLAGTADADRMLGLDGDDVLSGRGGGDWLIGGAGDDVLYGDGVG